MDAAAPTAPEAAEAAVAFAAPTPCPTKPGAPIEGAASEAGSAKKGSLTEAWLHVYDLGHMFKWALNSWARIGNMGAFHCGVEVLSVEWCFQAVTHCRADDKRTGVTSHRVRHHPRHVYRESVWLGESPLNQEDIRTVMQDLEQAWLAVSYHFVRRNCVDFAEELHRRLRVPVPFPAWVRGCSKSILQHTPLASSDESWYTLSSCKSCNSGSSSDCSSCTGWCDAASNSASSAPSSQAKRGEQTAEETEEAQVPHCICGGGTPSDATSPKADHCGATVAAAEEAGGRGDCTSLMEAALAAGSGGEAVDVNTPHRGVEDQSDPVTVGDASYYKFASGKLARFLGTVRRRKQRIVFVPHSLPLRTPARETI